jgi:hypothetical protein
VNCPRDYAECSVCDNESIENEIRKAEIREKKVIVVMCVVALWVMMWAGCSTVAHADSTVHISGAVVVPYSDEEIVNAIRKAEGTWTYGIKSIKCETEKECRQICLNTVRNNRKRFARLSVSSQEFIHFLGSRYCPIGADNDPRGLNKNWEKNVRYFLAKARAK